VESLNYLIGEGGQRNSKRYLCIKGKEEGGAFKAIANEARNRHSCGSDNEVIVNREEGGSNHIKQSREKDGR